MAILSLQSSVVRGYVGNAAALPLLHRMGVDVWPIDTVMFSNHPAHGAFTGQTHDPVGIADLVQGLSGSFDQCDGVLSGYLGQVGTGLVLLDAVAAVKQVRPDALYCCDPVMGDNGASYVAAGLPEFFRDHGISVADMITPNVYEAAWLTGMTIKSLDTARDAAQALRAMGPGLVVITGISCGAELATLALDGELAWVVMTPKLGLASHGAGDAFTALFLGCYLASRSARDALSRAASGLHAILQTSLDAKNDGDLRLIQALDAAVAPRKLYAAQQL